VSGYGNANAADGGELVDIDTLRPADSPRLAGQDPDHVRMLAESDAALPPILVDRRTMRVVDGMHRLGAMTLRGARQIAVRFFDGPADAAFLAAVRENIAHGLPLSRADREAAVVRIIGSLPDLSDRSIAVVCGVSHRTVAGIRSRATGQGTQLHARTGLDGRVRPIDSAAGRRAAEELLHARPGASLREIARAAGVAPNTVRDVRARMARGQDPVPTGRPRGGPRTGTSRGKASAAGHADVDIHSVLLNMKRDPTIRFTDAGRKLLHWLDVHAANVDSWPDLIEVIPPYHAGSAAAVARRYARVWDAIADRLDSQPAQIRTEPPIAQ